ncbi:zinc ribbon domain-containing protein [uncultured Thermus sp.]|uniref:zinc ribbon domain-containing protein n=1 Tax=uncultured Thermus sp. TaxID=157149 RepID=UPI00261ECADC|nr:zinc ribbon domain-containing protein [uncultured Thermus sp.]
MQTGDTWTPHIRRRSVWSRSPREAGRQVLGVDPRHTSQDCPACGHREKSPLWVREFPCPSSGTPLHQDVAAAINILARAWTEPAGTGLHQKPRSRAKPVSCGPPL